MNRCRESEVHSPEAPFSTSVGPVGVPYLLWHTTVYQNGNQANAFKVHSTGERVRESARICEKQKQTWNLLSRPYHNVVNSSAKEKSRILDNMCLCKERPTRRNYIYGGVGSLDPHDEVGFKVALSQCLKLRKSRQ